MNGVMLTTKMFSRSLNNYILSETDDDTEHKCNDFFIQKGSILRGILLYTPAIPTEPDVFRSKGWQDIFQPGILRKVHFKG